MIFTPGKKIYTTFQAFQITHNYEVKIKQKIKKRNKRKPKEGQQETTTKKQ